MLSIKSRALFELEIRKKGTQCTVVCDISMDQLVLLQMIIRENPHFTSSLRAKVGKKGV